MKYKGYTGLVELEEGSDVLFGRVIGLRDVITFQGESVAEVTQAFHDSVDDYLEFCAERGESPEKPYSGQFVLRLNPQLHRELANLAQARSTSLNALIENILEKNVGLDVQTQVAQSGEIPRQEYLGRTIRTIGVTKVTKDTNKKRKRIGS
jgi:predicted HicB family RNase H-like nuclease